MHSRLHSGCNSVAHGLAMRSSLAKDGLGCGFFCGSRACFPKGRVSLYQGPMRSDVKSIKRKAIRMRRTEKIRPVADGNRPLYANGAWYATSTVLKQFLSYKFCWHHGFESRLWYLFSWQGGREPIKIGFGFMASHT